MVFVMVITIALGMIVNSAGGMASGAGVSICGTANNPPCTSANNPYNTTPNNASVLSALSVFRFFNPGSGYTDLINGSFFNNPLGFFTSWFTPSEAQAIDRALFNFGAFQSFQAGPFILMDCGAPDPYFVAAGGAAPNLASVLLSESTVLSVLTNGNSHAFVRACTMDASTLQTWTNATIPTTETGPDTLLNTTAAASNLQQYCGYGIDASNPFASQCEMLLKDLQSALGNRCTNPLISWTLSCRNDAVSYLANLLVDTKSIPFSAFNTALCSDVSIGCPSYVLPSQFPGQQAGTDLVFLSCLPSSDNTNPQSCNMNLIVPASPGQVIGWQVWTKYYFSCTPLIYKSTGYQTGAASTVAGTDIGIANSPGMVCSAYATQTQIPSWLGWLEPLVLLVIGSTLIILSLGIGIRLSGNGTIAGTGTGATGSIWSNPQGTRLVQVFALGLILWSFISSEFLYAWFIFPFGFGDLLYTVMSVLFLYALWERATLGWTG